MKFLRLIYNEIFKQVKKKSFIITFGLILLFAIAFPIINKATGSETEHNYDNYEIEYLEQIEINTENDEEKEIFENLTDIRIEGLTLRHEKDIIDTNYRYMLIEENISKKQQLEVIDYLLEGKSFDEINNVVNKIDAYTFDISSFNGLSNDELEQIKTSLESEIKEIDEVVNNDNYMYFINEKIEEYNNLLKENENEQKSTTNKTKLENLKTKNKKINDILEVYNYLKEENVSSSNDFRVEESENLLQYIESLYTPNLTEKELASQSKMDYKEYEKIYEDEQKAYKEKIEESWYMIKQNKNFNEPGVKTSLNSSLTVVQLLGILVIIITGGIMSSEFSKGSIRLLVIRPNKRWKILLSKFLAFLIITIASILITTIVCILANGFVYGFSDYLTNSLAFSGGEIVQKSYLLGVFKDAFILSIPVIFVGILTFMLSVVTTNTALSVGLGMAVMYGYMIALQVAVMLNIPLIDLTFLPYLSYQSFMDPIDLYEYSMSLGYNLTMLKGNIVLLIWSVIFYFIANIVFIKRDIKN